MPADGVVGVEYGKDEGCSVVCFQPVDFPSFGRCEGRGAKDGVGKTEFGGGVGFYPEREVINLSVLPTCGGGEPVGDGEDPGYVVAHTVAVGVVYGVDAFLEWGFEPIDVGVWDDAVQLGIIEGVVGGQVGVGYLAVSFPFVQIEGDDVAVVVFEEGCYTVVVGQVFSVHGDGKIFDVGVGTSQVRLSVVVVG